MSAAAKRAPQQDAGPGAMRPEGYQERKEALPPFEVHLVSYRLGQSFRCTVDNVDPGAVIARAEGATRAEAESKALRMARMLLAPAARKMESS